MSKAYIDHERCKGCGLCINYCRNNAVEMTEKINTRGYKYVCVLPENCIGCGICYTVCPEGVFSIKEEEA